MSRGLSIAARLGIDGDNSRIELVHLVELELDAPTGVLRLTDAQQDLEWEGQTYTRGGNLLGFSDVEESASLLVNEVTVSLSGVDQALIAIVLQEHYIDRPLRIKRGTLNQVSRKLTAVEPLFEGRINAPAVAEDPDNGSSTVSLSASSIWVDFERSPGRKTNHEQQQQFFPGDMGFQFAAQTFGSLPWGRAS